MLNSVILWRFFAKEGLNCHSIWGIEDDGFLQSYCDIMATFDCHDKCARYREKGMGQDACVEENLCQICDYFGAKWYAC